jgi:hypothetical protein
MTDSVYVDAMRCVSSEDSADDIYLVMFRGRTIPPFNTGVASKGARRLLDRFRRRRAVEPRYTHGSVLSRCSLCGCRSRAGRREGHFGWHAHQPAVLVGRQVESGTGSASRRRSSTYRRSRQSGGLQRYQDGLRRVYRPTLANRRRRPYWWDPARHHRSRPNANIDVFQFGRRQVQGAIQGRLSVTLLATWPVTRLISFGRTIESANFRLRGRKKFSISASR